MILALLAAAFSLSVTAATNLNSSRSNIYRLVYAPVVTPSQATAILGTAAR